MDSKRQERVWLALLAPLWLVAAILQIDRLTSDMPLAWFPAYLVAPASADGPPVVRSLWPDAVDEAAEMLRAGDELLGFAGGDSLAGASPLRVIQQSYLAARDVEGRRVVAYRVRRDGALRVAELALIPVAHPWSQLVFSIGCGLSAMLVLWRSRGRRSPRAYAFAATAYALHFSSLFGGQPWQTAVGFGLLIVTAGLYPPLLLRGLLLFPPSAAPRSRLALAWPWLFAAGGPAAWMWLLGTPWYSGFAPLSAVFTATMVAMLAILARNYRLADARGRRQMRWGLYGLAVGSAPPLVVSLLASFDPGLRPLYELSLTTQLMIPFCFFVALVHDRLFDIDRLLSTTATLTLLGIVPVALLATVGVTVAERVSAASGVQEGTVTGVLLVVLLGPVPFANRRLSPRVHLWLFPERERFARDMRSLRRELGDCEGSEDVFQTLGKRLRESVELESLAIYAPAGDVYAVAYAHGPLVPPAFAAGGALLGALDAHEGPCPRAEWRRWTRRGLLDDNEAAGLEALAADWVIAARSEGAVDAVLCVGPKASGDYFTRWESALLEGVAERASWQLGRFDQEDRSRRDRRLVEELRRYVPTAVERALSDGGRPEAGERDVSIFFVDVRGSTGFAEGRSDTEVFSVIDRFTRGAAEIVEAHDGAVVEFAGDGFMAVFSDGRSDEGSGAGKERRAIEAGRAILAGAQGGLLPVERLGARPVGVGIATGSAFVGDVQVGSHAIWTALGDTANLAARLESLNKEFDSAMVVDERTWRAAGSAGEGFVALGAVEIRGRTQPESLRALRPEPAP